MPAVRLRRGRRGTLHVREGNLTPSRSPLSESQQAYAATDAWVCREVYAICAGEPSDEEWRLETRKAVAPAFWAVVPPGAPGVS